jgi:SAM-dependent methyltransferase
VTEFVPARGRPAVEGQEILRRRARMTASLVRLRGKTVLDFGCGNGAQTLELVSRGCSIIALDIDHSDLALLAARGAGAVLPVLYDGAHLPLGDASVDAAVSFEVLEHVPDDAAALDELCRVLKPGGDLVLTVPNKWWIFETHGARLPLLKWNRVPMLSWLPAPLHRRVAYARIYRKEQIAHLAGAHGFAVLRSAYVTAPLDVLGESRAKELLRIWPFGTDATRCPLFATAILLHCRKEAPP